MISGKREIWIIAEHQAGALRRNTLELLAGGQKLAGESAAPLGVILAGGRGTRELAGQLARYGADSIYCLEHPALESAHPELLSRVIAAAAGKYQPAAILLGATVKGAELAAATAARLRTGLTAHCCELSFNAGGRLRQVVPSLEGFCVFLSRGEPQMATISPGAWPLAEKPVPGKGKIIAVPLESLIEAGSLENRIHSSAVPVKPGVKLQESPVIVAGGMGVGSSGWPLLEELARLLGGVVGATRPAVDEGWAGHDQLIGQSGRTVSPRLYIAAGISGDPLHMSGVKKPGLSIAINKDRHAPIFKHVDYAVIGDCRLILLSMIEHMRAEAGR